MNEKKKFSTFNDGKLKNNKYALMAPSIVR